jgi:hypothetical protein
VQFNSTDLTNGEVLFNGEPFRSPLPVVINTPWTCRSRARLGAVRCAAWGTRTAPCRKPPCRFRSYPRERLPPALRAPSGGQRAVVRLGSARTHLSAREITLNMLEFRAISAEIGGAQWRPRSSSRQPFSQEAGKGTPRETHPAGAWQYTVADLERARDHSGGGAAPNCERPH